MKTWEVVLSPEAQEDLLGIYDWVAEKASPTMAFGYVERIENHLRGFERVAKRSPRRNDLRPGLRVSGFERRVTIAFVAEKNRGDDPASRLWGAGPGRARVILGYPHIRAAMSCSSLPTASA